MFKILRNQIVLFVLAAICWCNQAACSAPNWRALNSQDIADINALLPDLAIAGQGLWITPRANPPVAKPTEILHVHYKIEHGARGSHDRTLPFFNGVPVTAIPGPPLITAEEVVMANFIATLIPFTLPGAPLPIPVLPAKAMVNVKPKNHSREIRIPIPVGSVQIQKMGTSTPVDAKFCSIFLPAVLTGIPPGTLAPPPANVCTLYFRQ